VPAKVEGAWRLDGQELNLTQNFQMLSGTLGQAPISDGRLKGTEISFTADGVRYTGTVNGTRITGTRASGNDWSATRT